MVGRRAPAGFTLVELLVATAVTIIALGLTIALLHPSSVAFAALPEAVDAQQRLRVAVQTLADSVSGAGAGPSLGWGARASPVWPAFLPCRSLGEPLGQLAGGCAQDGAITVMTMGIAAPQAIVDQDVAAADAPIWLAPLSACALWTTPPAACTRALARSSPMARGPGTSLPISAVASDGSLFEHAGAPVSRLYAAGAIAGEVESAAYSLRVESTTGIPQLRRVTNGSSDLPVLDHVTALRFEGLRRPGSAAGAGRRRSGPPAHDVWPSAATDGDGRPARHVGTRRKLPVLPRQRRAGRAAGTVAGRGPRDWRAFPCPRSRTARGVLIPPRRTASTAICSASGSSASPCGSRHSRRRREARTRSSSAIPAWRGKRRGSYRTWRCTLTWRCGTPRGRRSAAGWRRRDEGVALVAAIVVMALVAAIGLGLVLTTSLEPLAARNYETSWAAACAADAGVAIAAHELASIADWDPVLGGQVASSILSQSATTVELPGGSSAGLAELTNLATCGHAAACSASEADAFTSERPWGPNNPRWQLFGHGRLDQLVSASPGMPPIEVVGRVGDDPADLDGDPFHDSTRLGPAGGSGAERGPGAGAIRAEAFAPRFGHRTVVATVGRPESGVRAGSPGGFLARVELILGVA